MRHLYDIEIIDTTICPPAKRRQLRRFLGRGKLPRYVITIPKRWLCNERAMKAFHRAGSALGVYCFLHHPTSKVSYGRAYDTYSRLESAVSEALRVP